MRMPRPLDHLVLPVASLEASRRRLSALGFTIAPDAVHPFGTANGCVFLPDGTYLEPLAVQDAAQAKRARTEGNSFVARDAAYRFRHGEDGFSALAFASDDAGADDAAYRAAALSGGDMLDFSRKVETPDGRSSTASFRLAFCADLRAPDLFFFSCQRLMPLPADRSRLEQHDNGVTGLREIVLTAADPAAFADLFMTASGAERFEEGSFGIDISLPNVKVKLLTPQGLEAFFDHRGLSPDPGLRAIGLVFAVKDLAVTDAVLAANGVTYTHRNNRSLVKAAPGQGALFAFEE